MEALLCPAPVSNLRDVIQQALRPPLKWDDSLGGTKLLFKCLSLLGSGLARPGERT